MLWIFNWGKKLISLFLSGKWSQWGDIRIRSLQTYSNYFWMIGDVSSYAQHLVDQPDLFEMEISITISIDNLVGQDRWGLWGLWSIFVMHGVTQKHPPLHPSLHFSGGQITSKEALPKASQLSMIYICHHFLLNAFYCLKQIAPMLLADHSSLEIIGLPKHGCVARSQ